VAEKHSKQRRRLGRRWESYALDFPAPSTLSQTAWALLGLMAAGLVEDKAVTLGVRYLTRTRAEDGFWKEERFTATGFSRVFFLRYHGYAKYFPLWAMARFRNLKKGDRHPVLVGM
jgi:squalene-hopene/tetraprenyl-beta-curcumene cyclase